MAELQIVEWVYGVGPLAKSHKIIEWVYGVDTFGVRSHKTIEWVYGVDTFGEAINGIFVLGYNRVNHFICLRILSEEGVERYSILRSFDYQN